MDFRVSYGENGQTFRTDVPCFVVGKGDLEAENQDLIIGDALKRPLGKVRAFGDFTSQSKKLIFILCDGTRPTPTALVLKHMHPEISKHQDIWFIIATGTHRPPTPGELRNIFGDFYDEFSNRIIVHDAHAAANMLTLGMTSRGTPVSLNRAVLEADGIVTVNSVEPHYFAGFTGGRKSFLPGVAGHRSIELNHSHATEPGAMPLALEGNPVSEDMAEAASFLKERRIFSVQTVMLPDGRLHSAFAGDMNSAFAKAVGSARDVYCADIPRRANIVITVAQPPMDRDLYQSQKAMEHGRLALEQGGIMILVSSCWDGIGDTGFYSLLSKLENGDDIANHLGNNYRLGNHKAARWLSLCAHSSLWGVTELEDEVLRTVRMKGFDTLQQAVDEAVRTIAGRGKKPRINLLPSGSFTVPKAVSE